MARKVTVESQKDKVVSINADRELFGRLLVVAKKREVNLKEVLSFELCSVPIALAHPDGSLRKTTKSTLMNLLEKDVTSKQNLPSSQLPTAYLVDAMALIQMVKAAGSATFGELSQKYEDIVTSTLRRNDCTRVDLIFDQYRPLSIKAGERKKRGEASSLEVNIHSGFTPIPKQCTIFISNPRNKERLAEYVCDLRISLSSLGQNPVLQESVQRVAESFICSVYTSARSFRVLMRRDIFSSVREG